MAYKTVKGTQFVKYVPKELLDTTFYDFNNVDDFEERKDENLRTPIFTPFKFEWVVLNTANTVEERIYTLRLFIHSAKSLIQYLELRRTNYVDFETHFNNYINSDVDILRYINTPNSQRFKLYQNTFPEVLNKIDSEITTLQNRITQAETFLANPFPGTMDVSIPPLFGLTPYFPDKFTLESNPLKFEPSIYDEEFLDLPTINNYYLGVFKQVRNSLLEDYNGNRKQIYPLVVPVKWDTPDREERTRLFGNYLEKLEGIEVDLINSRYKLKLYKEPEHHYESFLDLSSKYGPVNTDFSINSYNAVPNPTIIDGADSPYLLVNFTDPTEDFLVTEDTAPSGGPIRKQTVVSEACTLATNTPSTPTTFRQYNIENNCIVPLLTKELGKVSILDETETTGGFSNLNVPQSQQSGGGTLDRTRLETYNKTLIHQDLIFPGTLPIPSTLHNNPQNFIDLEDYNELNLRLYQGLGIHRTVIKFEIDIETTYFMRGRNVPPASFSEKELNTITNSVYFLSLLGNAVISSSEHISHEVTVNRQVSTVEGQDFDHPPATTLTNYPPPSDATVISQLLSSNNIYDYPLDFNPVLPSFRIGGAFGNFYYYPFLDIEDRPNDAEYDTGPKAYNIENVYLPLTFKQYPTKVAV